MGTAFDRITKKEIGNRFLKSVVSGQKFTRVFYEEVSFLKRHFKQCSWSDCRFKRTGFRAGTRFENCRFEDCRFEDCRFELQHTYIGGQSYFRDCEFKNCRFDSVQFWASSFERCSFACKFINVVFYGPEAAKDWQTELCEVDFSQSEFEDVDFRGGIDLSSAKLPASYVPENVRYGSGMIKENSKQLSKKQLP